MEGILNHYPFDYYYRGSTEIAVLPALVELYGNDSLQLEMQFLHLTVYLYDPDNEQG